MLQHHVKRATLLQLALLKFKATHQSQQLLFLCNINYSWKASSFNSNDVCVLSEASHAAQVEHPGCAVEPMGHE
jgi:hypothetical protein